MNIVQVGALNYGDRRDGTPRVLVLHIMAGTLAGCDQWFNDPACSTSAHFGVGKGGEVHQYVDTRFAAYANGFTTDALPPDHGPAAQFMASLPPMASPNRFSISIEHEGSPPDDLEGLQFASSVELAASLFGPDGPLAGIPASRETILRHGEIGGHPYCPGYPEETFTRYVEAVQSALAGVPPVAVASPPPAAVEDEMAVEMHGLDQAQTVALVAPFAAQVGDLVADRNGSAAYAVTAGLPIPMKPEKIYVLLEMDRPT